MSSTVFPQPPSTAAELSIAYGASAISALFTLPIGVISTRQLTSAKEDRKGIIATAKEITGEFGIFGLWKGLRATLVLCVNLAITYGATERLRIILFQGRAKLQPWESFSKYNLSKAPLPF
jgi:hypothetical protein